MTGKQIGQERPLRRDELRELLIDLFERHEPTFEKYQWPWENQRWYELVFCLLSTIEGRYIPNSRAALAMRVFVDLGLLGISALAASVTSDGQPDYKTPHIELLQDVLNRVGFEADQTRQAIGAMCETATTLHRSYRGKVQLLLRQHSEQMVDRVSEALPLTRYLGEDNGRTAVTHWLQNVLNIPLPVSSKGLDALCRDTGVEHTDVLEIVDDLDINVALLDEVLNEWLEVKE